jgi:hypothetical protein
MRDDFPKKIRSWSERAGMAILVAAFLASLLVEVRLALWLMGIAVVIAIAGHLLSVLVWLFGGKAGPS